MAEAISSSSGVASGAQLAALVMVQAQQTSDSSPPGRSTTAVPGQAQAAPSAAQANPTSQGSAARTARSAEHASPKALDDAVKSLQDYIKPQEVITLQVDKGSGHTFVKIVNAQTKQLILQIPSSQVLAMARKLQDMATPQGASGVLVDQEG